MVKQGGIKVKNRVEFEEAIHRESNKGLLLFFHGYNNTMEDALNAAAALLIKTQWNGNIIAYCWPSSGHMLSYLSDEKRMRESVKPFRIHVQQLFTGKQEISVVGHSMGGRLSFKILTGMVGSTTSTDTHPTPRVRVFVLAAAYLTTKGFVSRRNKLSSIAGLTVVYHHAKDIPLLLSEGIHMGQRRLGLMDWRFSLNNVVVDGSSLSWLHSLDVANLMTEDYDSYTEAAYYTLKHPSAEPHSYFLLSPLVYNDIKEVLRSQRHAPLPPPASLVNPDSNHTNVFYGQGRASLLFTNRL